MAIREDISLLGKKVSDLRTLIALRCGFPVSVFCLRTPEGLEMYDCNLLRDYQTELGTPPRRVIAPTARHSGSLIPDAQQEQGLFLN